jgi:hypothetical protein
MPKVFWRIEGVKGKTTIFRRTLPGDIERDQIVTILQRLACKHLTRNGILSASLRNNPPNLVPNSTDPPDGKRLVIWVSGSVDYIASFLQEDELEGKADFSDGD